MRNEENLQRLGKFNKGRKGRVPKSEATKFVVELLSDGEWHLVEDLVQKLLDSGLEIPRGGETAREESARIIVREIGKRNAYEVELRQTAKRHFYHKIRKSPVVVPGAALRSCVDCGRGNLDVASRVRRMLEYRIPKDGGRGKGDLCAARFKTSYVCIPCAEQELKAKGVEWRYKPPFAPPGSYGDNGKEAWEGETGTQ